MTKQLFSTAALCAAALATAQSNLAADILYKSGEKAADQGMTLKGWGSGSISQTDETSYAGTYSIQISSRNFFQGGIVTFANGADASKKFDDKNNLLKVTFKVADGSTRSFSGGGIPGAGSKFPGGPGGGGRFPGGAGGGAGGQGFPGGPGGFGGSGAPGGPGAPGGAGGRGGQGGFPGGPGGFGGGAGFPGGGGFKGGMGGAAGERATLKTIRLIVTTTDGKRSEAYVPVDTSSSSDNGWKISSIPLQAITGFDATNKVIKQLAFAGDTTSTFYVGDLRIINDSTPIHGEIAGSQSLNLALGDTVTFRASGTGGASILKYSWDFGTSPTPEEDAVGQAVVRKFRKSGTYKVVLTVSDYYGLKPAYTTSVNVKVN